MFQILRGPAPIVLIFCVTGYAFPQCPAKDATLPATPFKYPMISDQYSVQYRVADGDWASAKVYISYYGKTDASPLRGDSPYVRGTTSMSFVSIPAQRSADLKIRVSRLAGPFLESDQISVRPTPKRVSAVVLDDGTAELSTHTTDQFNGEQLILWWNRGSDGGSVESLALFLNPPYVAPASGANVRVVNSWADLAGLDGIDTLDFEGTILLQGTGAAVFPVAGNINTLYFGRNAWVQGKLSFTVKNSTTRKLYGPGVLDNSLFNYLNRNCNNTDDGAYALSSQGKNGNLTNFLIDGIVISDQNHAAADPFFSSTLNNVKTLGWNSNNGALRLSDGTT